MSDAIWDAAGSPLGDDPHTVGRWLTDRSLASPDKVAIDDRGVTITYGEFEERAQRLASLMRDAGYGRGDRIATISGNSIDHVVAFFACAKAGVAFSPLSWRLRPRELGQVIDRLTPALVLVDDEHAALAADALGHAVASPRTCLLGATGAEAHLALRTDGTARERGPVRDDDPLLIIFTSGSEAAPKGVVLTHANCFWNNLALGSAVHLRDDDVVLAVLPQFHVAAWNVQPLLAWWVGATVVLERSFQPDRVLQLLASRQVTALMGVPTHYRMLADAPRFADADLTGLRLAQVGGASIPAELFAQWQRRGVTLTQGYGLTEASPNVLCLPAARGADRAGVAGAPYPYVDVRVVDPESGLALDGAARGELQVRGPGVFAGYVGDPDATARAMDGEWLRTGDLVARDSAGLYRVIDRLKEIFISGGENVAPSEVEQALRRHPLITDAAVVAVPDRVWGERGFAFVVRTPGAALSADEVRAHARSELAAFKVPVGVEVLDEIPTAAIGKVARAQLRERARRLVLETADEPGGRA